jgi:outer membrane biosynthesis protein TonB
MDTELFQIVSLALLGAMVLLLLVAVSSLGGIKKAIKKGFAAAPAAQPEAATASHEANSEPSEPTPEPEPVTASAAESQPTAAEPEPQAEPAPQPAQAATPASETPQGVQAQPAAAADPQEQPFERNGRWWFRRGDELLVYDEQTGQWVPAPAGGTGAQPAPAGASVGTETAPQEQAGYWKCPSCGAVNGSTATSCRMCFAQRP